MPYFSRELLKKSKNVFLKEIFKVNPYYLVELKM